MKEFTIPSRDLDEYRKIVTELAKYAHELAQRDLTRQRIIYRPSMETEGGKLSLVADGQVIPEGWRLVVKQRVPNNMTLGRLRSWLLKRTDNVSILPTYDDYDDGYECRRSWLLKRYECSGCGKRFEGEAVLTIPPTRSSADGLTKCYCKLCAEERTSTTPS